MVKVPAKAASTAEKTERRSQNADYGMQLAKCWQQSAERILR